MDNNENLYEFLVQRATELTEDWYASLANVTGVYATEDEEKIRILKEHNKAFHLRFFRMFVTEEKTFYNEMEEWVVLVAKDESHLLTPMNAILHEFYRTRDQYLEEVRVYANIHQIPQETLDRWRSLILKTIDKVTIWFMVEYDKYSKERLMSHRELINELSSPVIKITDHTGLLPLVGDIDTERAAYILEETLRQCDEKKLDRLYIDLSGVVMIDTMVAQQLFLLHDALSLIGVQTTLCGIRPEIAQTATQLGLSFDTISIYATLERALNTQVFQKS